MVELNFLLFERNNVLHSTLIIHTSTLSHEAPLHHRPGQARGDGPDCEGQCGPSRCSSSDGAQELSAPFGLPGAAALGRRLHLLGTLRGEARPCGSPGVPASGPRACAGLHRGRDGGDLRDVLARRLQLARAACALRRVRPREGLQRRPARQPRVFVRGLPRLRSVLPRLALRRDVGGAGGAGTARSSRRAGGSPHSRALRRLCRRLRRTRRTVRREAGPIRQSNDPNHQALSPLDQPGRRRGDQRSRVRDPARHRRGQAAERTPSFILQRSTSSSSRANTWSVMRAISRRTSST